MIDLRDLQNHVFVLSFLSEFLQGLIFYIE